MKTQLLEDISESATLFLVPSGTVADTKSHQGGPDIAQAPAAAPARPRSKYAWRQRPASEPAVIAAQQDEAPPPLEIPQPPSEPVAGVETQHIPRHQVHEPAIPPAEFTFAAQATQSNPVPQGGGFHFAPPWPTMPTPIRVRRKPSWFDRSARRYLLWGSCVLSAALVVQAASLLDEKRKDTAPPAPAANQLKAEPKIDKATKGRAIGAKEITPGLGGEVQVVPGAPSSLERALPSTAPTVPPLVLLKPDPSNVTKVEPTVALEDGREVLLAQPKPERVAEQAPDVALSKAMPRPKREQLAVASKPARARGERARKPEMQTQKKLALESTTSATLKACRELGYSAEQCVKRACSMTKHGFVCRGKVRIGSGMK
jgi:hypothetical protein